MKATQDSIVQKYEKTRLRTVEEEAFGVTPPPKNEVFRSQFCRYGAQVAETSKQRV